MSEFSVNKLALFPDKLNALKRAYDEREVDFSYPISVELSLTDACNFLCHWCSDVDLRKRLKGHMKKDTLFSLLEDLARNGTKGITIEGGGEPTLHPDLPATISHIREKGMASGLITNGARFNFKDELDDLEWVRISLDVSDSSQMDLLKKKGAFDEVMKNITEMTRRKKRTVIGTSYIVTNKNRKGLEEMVQRLRDIGVEYIQVKPVVDHPELTIEKDDSLHELKKFETKQFRVFLDALNDNLVTGNAGLSCVSNSLTGIVTANGNVYFCGRLNTDPDWPPLGNINNNTFHEIWHSEERVRQSQLMHEPQNCKKKCPQCRITKFNISVDKISHGETVPALDATVKTPHFI